jgi:hypothetical protein
MAGPQDLTELGIWTRPLASHLGAEGKFDLLLSSLRLSKAQRHGRRLLLVAALLVLPLFPHSGSLGGRSLAQTAPAGGLVDIAANVGVAEVTRTWSADVADYDNDGREEWVFIRHNPQKATLPLPSVYDRKSGGTYTDVNFLKTGRDRHMCTFGEFGGKVAPGGDAVARGDVNADGLLDIFCTVGLTASSENELRLQKPDGTFTGDRAPELGLTDNTFGRYRTATFIHANTDMYPDIYVTRYYGSSNTVDDPSDPDPYPNELWLNRGTDAQGAFLGFSRDASFGLDQRIGAPKEVKSCAQAIDYDHDGDQDLLVCALVNMFVYRNDGGTGFTNVAKQGKAWGDWHDAEYADFNNDAWGDLVRVRPEALQVKLWDPISGSFADPVLTRSWTNSPSGQDLTTGDFNGDGLRDIYVVRNCPKTHKFIDDRDQVLWGNGAGGFAKETLPAVRRGKGCGNTVSAIQRDIDPALELIVLNGHTLRAGPTQFFDWRPL